MASAAPAALSTAALVSGAWVPQPSATRGACARTRLHAATAAVVGAITIIPSTPWSRNRSTAPSTLRRSRAGRLAMDTK